MHEFTISVKASGDYTEAELKEYLLFSLGFGACSLNNPFIDEDCETNLTDVNII